MTNALRVLRKVRNMFSTDDEEIKKWEEAWKKVVVLPPRYAIVRPDWVVRVKIEKEQNDQ